MGVGGGRGFLLRIGKVTGKKPGVKSVAGFGPEEFDDFLVPVLGQKGSPVLAAEEFNNFILPVIGQKGLPVFPVEEFNDFI